jgi:putative zinc finger protein
VTVTGGSRPHGSHLGSLVSAYVDRDLPAGVLLGCDQHLAVCGACRAAAEDERRLLESMRRTTTPCLSSSLQSALLGLAASAAPVGERPHLPVVDPAAPALHRSPVRAAVLAGLAAGASAAAALSLGVAGVGGSGPGPTTPSSPAVRLPAAATVARGPSRPSRPLVEVPSWGAVPAADVLSVTGSPAALQLPGTASRAAPSARLAHFPHE